MSSKVHATSLNHKLTVIKPKPRHQDGETLGLFFFILGVFVKRTLIFMWDGWSSPFKITCLAAGFRCKTSTCHPSSMCSERSVDLMDARLLSRTAGGTGSWQNSGTHWTGFCCVWAKSCTFLHPGDLLPDSPWWLLLLRNTTNTTC